MPDLPEPDITAAVDISIAHLDEAALLGGPNTAALAMLGEDERERRSRLRFAKDRNAFALAHVLLRTSLSRHADLPPAAWSFERGSHGKPALSPAQMAAYGLHFSLSHAGAVAACAVTRIGAVGVDVEPPDRDIDIPALTSIALTTDEAAALAGLDAAAARRRFLIFWTLKEAYVKARGLGLSLPMQQCAFTLDPPRLAEPMEDRTGWTFDTRADGRRCIVSVAVSNPQASPVIFRYRYSGTVA